MKKIRVGVLGATGAVGAEMIKILAEREFPIEELVPMASERSAGKQMDFNGGKVTVKEAGKEAFKGLDIILGAAENDIAEAFADDIVNAGAIFIDNSSAFRLNDNVPLVIPEINKGDIKKHCGVIANPNCTTIVSLMAVKPISDISPVETMVVSSYQATSGAGINGPIELMAEAKAISEGTEIPTPKVFQHQIAYNVIPQIGGFNDNGYSTEEMKLMNEGRKIMHLPSLKVSCTCVRVPVVRSHSVSIQLVTKKKVTPQEARKAIAAFPGDVLKDDLPNSVYPMPLDTSDQDLIFVGRIREDLTNQRGLMLWCCGDQIRKGAATNAVQIAEEVIKTL